MAASLPHTVIEWRARVTAVYSSSLVRMRELGSGRSTATASTCEPWLLWIVSAWTVSTASSRVGLISTSPPWRSKTARLAAAVAGDDHAGVAVEEPQAVVVLRHEQRPADVPGVLGEAVEFVREPALDDAVPGGDAVGAAAVGAEEAE